MMSVRVADESRVAGISPMEMRDGQIARIVSDTGGQFVGKIVQRVYDDLRVVGEYGGSGWAGLCSHKHGSLKMKVEVLENGTVLVVENNK
jgi:hypothetical protein